MKTHYEVLNIAPDAPVEIIHAVYNALSTEFTLSDDIENLNIAYEILSDSIKRKAYDESLVAKDRIPEQPSLEKAIFSSEQSEEKPKNNRNFPLKTVVATIFGISLIFFLAKYQTEIISFSKSKLSELVTTTTTPPPPQINSQKPEASKVEQIIVTASTTEKIPEVTNAIDVSKPKEIVALPNNEKIEPVTNQATNEQEKAKPIEFEKLLVEEKVRSENLVREIEAQKLAHQEQIEQNEKESEKIKQAEIDKVLVEEKARNAALIREIEMQKLEKAKQIELEKVSTLQKAKQIEIDKLLASEKMRTDDAAKQKETLQLQEKTISAIQQKVNEHWKNLVENADFSLLNPQAVSKFKSVISVTLASSGKVLDTTIEKSSDYAGFDQVADKAVNSASPFPVPENEKLFEKKFEKLTFVFERHAVSIK